jgi:caffeoyl-CoA O-methyltransferase
MPTKTESPWLDPEIARYVAARCEPPDNVLADLALETERSTGDRAGMQIAPDQGALLGLLVRLVGARSAVEVGTFTGYSSICIARALAPGGRLLCCDVSEHWTAIARRAWERAGLSDRIELHLAPALDTLRSLPTEATIDFAFIDADKGRYGVYFDELVTRIRPGGLICIDNTLWSGQVIDAAVDDAETEAIRAFNDKVAGDERVESWILPIADGLTLARVR